MKCCWILAVLVSGCAFAQSEEPRFEVASIRPSQDCAPPAPPPPGAGGQLKGPPAPMAAPPKFVPAEPQIRFTFCGTVHGLLVTAYVREYGIPSAENPNLRLLPTDFPIEGEPGWVRSDTYAIVAQADRPVSFDVMNGPMLRALLEDRFQLKIHAEKRNRPAYALTVDRGGLKLPRSTCRETQTCPLYGSTVKGAWLTVDQYAGTLREFAMLLLLDRPVIDRTGVSGVFDYHFEFGPDETTPMFQTRMQRLRDPNAPPDPGGGPSIFTALREQLGLRLEAVEALQDVLVVDSIERPSEN